MIVNIRGTSGSGKSYLVRHVMAYYDNKEAIHIEGRKQPLYYLLRHEGFRDLAVLGHYETACGGCDTINGLDWIYRLVREQHEAGRHVLFEGLLLSNEVERTKLLPDVQVICLTKVPLDVCIESINARRRARGVMEPVATKNTSAKWDQIQRVAVRLEQAGVVTHRCDRQEAMDLLEQIFEIA